MAMLVNDLRTTEDIESDSLPDGWAKLVNDSRTEDTESDWLPDGRARPVTDSVDENLGLEV